MSATVPLARPRPWRLVRRAFRQVTYQNRLLVRSPSGAFFTFFVPLMVMFALILVYGDGTSSNLGGVRWPRFYAPAMAAFAIGNACYVSELTGVTMARDHGMLKRVRGTPMPAWIYLFGRAGSAASLALLSTSAVLGIGSGIYSIPFPWHAIVGLAFAGFIGAACFCLLGLAATSIVPTAEAAMPAAFGSLLSLSFISGVFFPEGNNPYWLRLVAEIFPLRPLARCLETPFLGATMSTSTYWQQIAIMAAWGAVAAVVIIRYFPWEQTSARGSGAG